MLFHSTVECFSDVSMVPSTSERTQTTTATASTGYPRASGNSPGSQREASVAGNAKVIAARGLADLAM